jgi:hypothetical protein
VAYDATRATGDLDAVFVPAGIVRQAATAVAEHRRLTEDWLNDAVKEFLPGPDPDAQRWPLSSSAPGRSRRPGKCMDTVNLVHKYSFQNYTFVMRV